ncbi:FYVE, RhoGEF and PH domain-containing protein 4-like [Rhinophrynus dorsalis]
MDLPVPPKPAELTPSPLSHQHHTPVHRTFPRGRPRMDDITQSSGEKSSKISDLISRFEGSSPNDLRKDSLNDMNNGPNHKPRTKVIVQPFMEHPLLQKQSTSQDLLQDPPKVTANGISRTHTVELEENKTLPTAEIQTAPLSERQGTSGTPSEPPAQSYQATVELLVNGDGSDVPRDISFKSRSRGHTNEGYSETEGPVQLQSESKESEDNQSVNSSVDQPAEIKETNEQKLHNIANELLQTERAYVSRLELLQTFHNALLKEAKQGSFPPEVLTKIFSNITSIHSFHVQFLLPQLESRMKEWSVSPRIGDILQKLAPFLKMYAEYVRNFDNAMETVNHYINRNAQFKYVIEQIQVNEGPSATILSLGL